MKPKKPGQVNIPSEGLRYPATQLNNDTDYVRIKFHKYTPPFSTQGFNNTSGIQGYNQSVSDLGNQIGGDVILYMPQDISAQYGANWSDMNFSNIARSALGSLGSAFDGQFGQAASDALRQAQSSLDNGLNKGTLFAKGLSEVLGKTNFGNVSVNDIYAGITGEIFNPNTEVIYKGPKMRGFSLEFKMVPSNSREADNIKNIIKLFKFAMLPSYGKANSSGISSFVNMPAIADVTFMTGNSENSNVTQFKPSAMVDLDISYTPDGAWATYADGSPVATTLKATFQELKMVYQEEIEQGY